MMRGSGREGAGIEEGNAVLATAGIQQRVPATADQVPYLRAEVLAFCDAHLDLPNDVRDDVRLAVTEACTNAVLHAYPSGPGEVTVTTRVDDHQLTVEVSDEGVGIDTRPASGGLGLGIALMRAIADTRISDGGGTTVALRFPLTAGA